MYRIANFYHHGSVNIGDASTSPLLYFDFGCKVTRLSLAKVETSHANVSIFGGGILPQVADIQAVKSSIRIVWGGAFTDSNLRPYTYGINDFEGCDLVGLRDIRGPSNSEWVPCASCMSPLFDVSWPVRHNVVIYDNPERMPLEIGGIPRMSNNVSTMEEAIRFIASGEIVVTSSYHGMYWGFLLGRRVLVVPFGAKFFGLGEDIPVTTTGEVTQYLSQACSKPGFLRECRMTNLAFFDKVKSVLRRFSEY